MTKKQILFSTLIFGATTNIALGMDENKGTIVKIKYEYEAQNKMQRCKKPMLAKDSKKLERRLTKLRLTMMRKPIMERLNEPEITKEEYKATLDAGWNNNFPKLPLKDFKASYTGHEKNSTYGYPPLPLQPADFSDFDAQQYEENYQKAIDHELNTRITQEDIDRGTTWAFYRADELETALLCNLHTIKQQQEINKQQ